MKIGLLTYHWVPNFGAQLQTLSTYNYLKRSGYSPIIINWVPKDTKAYYAGVMPEQRQKHADFINRNCLLTEEFSEPNKVLSILNHNEITHVVIGSDSLFNIYKPFRSIRSFKMIYPSLDHQYPNPFWGVGYESIPHAALSVSSQNAKYTSFEKDRTKIGDALQQFKTITVRDKWTQSLVSYFTNGNVVPDITPDPVFAFNSNVPQKLTKQEFCKNNNLPEKYILLSFSNGRMRAPKSWIESIVRKFNKEGYECVELGKVGGQKLDLDCVYSLPIDPMDWYNVIRFSSAYIGVLMHPIVVCLHNSIPFFSIDHYGTGPLFMTKKTSSKIYDILSKANLLDYHFLQRNHIALPSSEKVFELVMDFPRDKCLRFSEMQQQRCLDNMNFVVSGLING